MVFSLVVFWIHLLDSGCTWVLHTFICSFLSLLIFFIGPSSIHSYLVIITCFLFLTASLLPRIKLLSAQLVYITKNPSSVYFKSMQGPVVLLWLSMSWCAWYYLHQNALAWTKIKLPLAKAHKCHLSCGIFQNLWVQSNISLNCLQILYIRMLCLHPIPWQHSKVPYKRKSRWLEWSHYLHKSFHFECSLRFYTAFLFHYICWVNNLGSFWHYVFLAHFSHIIHDHLAIFIFNFFFSHACIIFFLWSHYSSWYLFQFCAEIN